MKEVKRLLDYIAEHPKLTLTQAVASYLKLYPARALLLIVELVNDRNKTTS